MKTLLVALVLALCALPGIAAAQAPDAVLPDWERLEPAQRDLLIAPMRERWDAHPEARARMLDHARRWQALPPGQRQRAQRGMARWERMDPQRRVQMQALFERTRGMPKAQRREVFALFHAMRDMAPAQREALRREWGRMTPAQRHDWMRAHTPPRWHRPDPPGEPPGPDAP